MLCEDEEENVLYSGCVHCVDTAMEYEAVDGLLRKVDRILG